MPPLRTESEDEEEDEDSESDDHKEKKSKKSKKNDASASTLATTSKAVKREGNVPRKNEGASKAQIPDDDVLSFMQTKDLSEAIQTLDGQKLERVIQIILEGVPEIRDVRSLSSKVILHP